MKLANNSIFKIAAAVISTSAMSAIAIPAHANNLAMTWTSENIANGQNGGLNVQGGTTMVGCNINGQICEAISGGDTADTESRRVLCFVPDTIPEPATYASYFTQAWADPNHSYRRGGNGIDNWRFYFGWSGGHIYVTRQTVVGADITSKAVGDFICKNELKNNYPLKSSARMMEFHDNGTGGWSAGGMILKNNARKGPQQQKKIARRLLTKNAGTERFWITINDQNTNPWD